MTTATAASTDTPLIYEVEQSPFGHFHLHLSRLIARMINNLYRTLPAERLESLLAEYPFISSYRQQIANLPYEQWLTEFEADSPAHLPLKALVEELQLTNDHLDLLLAAGLLEEDIRFGAFFAALQHPMTSRHPCLGILNWLLDLDHSDTPVWRAAETLARHGLLTIHKGEDTVRLEWTLQVPLPLWDGMRGERVTHPSGRLHRQAAAEFPTLEQLILPNTLHEKFPQLPKMMQRNQLNTLVLRGMSGSGRRTLLGVIARASGRDLLLHDEEELTDADRQLLGPLATLTNALPVIRLQANAGETLKVNRLPGYHGPLGITMGRMGGLEGSGMENALTLNLPSPTLSQRQRFWQAAALPMAAGDAAVIANRFLLTGGRIQQVGRLAHSNMILDGRETATPDDVRQAMQAANRQVLETLATPLTAVDDWHSLIVPERVESELHVLEARCRSREQLLDHVGRAFAQTLNRGVRALFSGPSGTGKTLAARALAGTLQMDVYRVDLASVVNKYIGETEKNLNRIFTYAEELDIILLLDEGDSLMTQRTDVRGANDRYANLETNFLLQRLESYEGIILITTNASQRIDEAFIRRLDVVVDFVLPEAEERRLLWQIHLPLTHEIETGFLERVIQRCKLSGGQIRNAALHASLLALHGERPVTTGDLADALQREYRKAGYPYPLSGLQVKG